MTTTTTSGAADLPEALLTIAREIEALKRECGMDPESAIAIQNGRYMAISYKVRALAAGQATAAQAVVPAGWKLVPVDATDEMVRATDEVNFENGDTDGTLHNVWHVMIAAAPAQPAAQQGVAYAAPPDERAAFEAQFPVPFGVHWDGIKYVIKDSHISSYRCDRFVGQWDAWQASRAAHASADSVQEDAAQRESHAD